MVPVNAGGRAATLMVTSVCWVVVTKPTPDPVAATVMTAWPGLTPVTTPVVLVTVAIDGWLEV